MTMPKSNSGTRKSTIITVEVDSSEAQKLLDAFANGSLSELGVIDVRIASANGDKRWAADELTKQQLPSNRNPASD